MTTETVVETVQAGRAHLQNCVDFMKILTNIDDGAAPSKTLTRLLRLLCRYGKSIPYMGVILATVERMLPDEDSSDVVRLLQNLSEQIKAVRHDIRELENKINWTAVKLQYCDIVTKIETGMEYLSKILESTNEERAHFEERLKELCSNQTMTLAVKNLLKGLTGEGLLHNDILEAIYHDTRGHSGRFVLMCIRFLQLFSGGLTVIAAYETLLRGEEAALEIQTLFEGYTEKLKTRFEVFQQRCKDCCRDNMLEDLNEVLDSNRSNKDAAVHLSKLLREKYDWLENYCIICKESIFIDYKFSGDRVESLERNGKFGVIFYREIPEAPDSTNLPILEQDRRRFQVRQIITETDKDCWFSDATRINDVLKANLDSIGLFLWGCATVKAKRIIKFPLVAIPGLIGSRIALNGFETSVENGETSAAAVFYIEGRKHLCLVSPYEQ